MNFIFPGLIVAVLLLAGMIYRLTDRTKSMLTSAGERRHYLLYVPPGYDATKPVPLVITIHGFAQWPAHQRRISRWNELANAYGFIVVYPSGTGFPKRWRTRAMPGSQADPSADVLFISELIDRLGKEYNIDPTRIYANGLSNGGGMSYLLACERSERIAAIGTVAGAFHTSLGRCRPSRPVPVILFHGTADPIVPYRGGAFHGQDAFPAIPAWVEELARQNGCTEPPQPVPSNGEVSGIRYTGGAAEVIFYTITGGGHTWPGGRPIPAWIAGHTSMDIDASRTMWEFFQRHPLQ